MGSGDLLSIEPSGLKFLFVVKKQMSCPLQLSNKTGNYVVFKVKTTDPKKYCVRPNTGIILPWSTCDVIVTMQAQTEAPLVLQSKDKFLIQSVIASPNTKNEDINREMFNKEEGHVVEESKLRVVYVMPPQLPSNVQERPEEVSSLKGSVPKNDNLNSSEFTSVTSSMLKSRSFLATLTTQTEALISKLKGMKINAFQHNSLLQKKLGNVQSKNAKNTSTPIVEDLEMPLLSEHGDKPDIQKIMAIEAALKDANTKIQALEATLEDTKLVLKGLGRRIEDLSS